MMFSFQNSGQNNESSICNSHQQGVESGDFGRPSPRRKGIRNGYQYRQGRYADQVQRLQDALDNVRNVLGGDEGYFEQAIFHWNNLQFRMEPDNFSDGIAEINRGTGEVTVFGPAFADGQDPLEITIGHELGHNLQKFLNSDGSSREGSHVERELDQWAECHF